MHSIEPAVVMNNSAKTPDMYHNDWFGQTTTLHEKQTFFNEQDLNPTKNFEWSSATLQYYTSVGIIEIIDYKQYFTMCIDLCVLLFNTYHKIHELQQL